jgi:hypothetical protein
MLRKLMWLLVPVLAVGVPPLVYNGGTWWTQAKQRIVPLLSLNGGPGSGAAPGTSAPSAPAGSSPTSSVASLPAPGEAADLPEDRMAQVDLGDALRFDVTPAWVMERWPWVSAGLSQLPLAGYRVPLVSGSAEDDLAGSLTYYFNARQQVARITFQGTTGDARKLIRLLISRYGFGRRITNDPALFRYEVPVTKGPVQSYLDLRLDRPKDAYRRFDVTLVIERPE